MSSGKRFRFSKSISILALAAPAFLLNQAVNAAGFTGSTSWGSNSDEILATCSSTGSVANGTTKIDGNVYTVDKNVTCDFQASPLLAAQTGVSCTLTLQYVLNGIPSCVKSGKNFVQQIRATCEDAGSGKVAVSGSLDCASVLYADNTTNSLSDPLFIASKFNLDNRLCKQIFQASTNPVVVLSHDITYTDSACTQLLVDTTATTMKSCHGDGGALDCVDKQEKAPASGFQVAFGTAQNDTNAACQFNPNTVQSSCSGNKDNGVITGVFLGQPPAGSDSLLLAIDVTTIDQKTVELNGFPAKSCTISDVNNDGIPDLQCKFVSCQTPSSGGGSIFIGGDGNLTMNANRSSGSEVQCSGTVNIN